MSKLNLLMFVTSACLFPTSTFAKQNAPDPQLRAVLQKAQALLAQQDFVGAEKILRPATLKYSDKPAPWFLLGSALNGQKTGRVFVVAGGDYGETKR